MLELRDESGVYDEFGMLYSDSGKDFESISEYAEWSEISNKVALGYRFAPVWLRIDVVNRGVPKDYYLEFSEPFAHILDFYVVGQNGVEYRPNGLAVPIEERSIPYHLPAIKLHFEENEEKTIYIHYLSKFTSFGEFALYDGHSYERKKEVYNAFYFFYFGGIVIIAIYNLFLFLALRDRSYIYYVGYAFTFMGWVFLYSGFSLYFIDSDLHYILHFSTPFAFVFFTLFTQHILDTKKYLPSIDKVLNFIKFILLASSLYVIFDLNRGYFLANVIGVFYFPFIVYVAIMSIKKGVKTAKFYLIAFLIFLFTMSILTNLAMGLIEFNYVAKYSFILGSMIEMVLFSLLLAYRINILKEERLEAQSKLLEIVNDEASRLERIVNSRTEDLKKANTDLQSMIEEREMLLKELHHRVKNNLQTITGMLWIQNKKNLSKEGSELFNDILQRIKSISLVHELLYASDSISKIPTKLYFEQLIDSMRVGMSGKDMSILKNIEEVDLGIEETIILGTIAVEAITNSIKHAFPSVKTPTIYVHLLKNGNNCALIIKDNGVGFDEENAKHNGLGLKIIEKTAAKLRDVKIKYQNKNGCQFTLEFKLE